MPDKLSVLRASYRVMKPGGLIGFLVIAIADDLTAQEKTRMADDDIGPDYADGGPGYPLLMESAGFGRVDVHDLSAEYLDTTSAWIRERVAEAAELQAIWGRETFDERMASQRRSLEAVRDGRLRRYLVTGVRE